MSRGTAVAVGLGVPRWIWAVDWLLGALLALIVVRALWAWHDERGQRAETVTAAPATASAVHRITRDGWQVLRPVDGPGVPPPPRPEMVRELSPEVYEVREVPADLDVGCNHIVPLFRAGRAVGFKLFGIRPGSFAAQLGIKNGDAVLQVNGMPLDSPERALHVYSANKDAERVVVALERNGQPLTVTYRLRRRAAEAPRR